MNLNLQRNFQSKEPRLSSSRSVKNENTNLDFIKKLKQFSNNSKYPTPTLAYEELSDFIKIPASNIIFGNGSDSLLKDLTLMLDYKTIQILDCSYEMAFFYNNLFEKEIFVNKWNYNSKFELQTDINEIYADVLYLVSPHCPTGVEFTYEQIEQYTQKFKYVILDQAYTNPLLFDLRFFKLPNLIILKTFSKLGGVPGLRLGYCVANKLIINKLALVKNLYEITMTGQEYLNFICKNSWIIDDNIKELDRNRNNLALKYRNVYSAGNFATILNCNELQGKNYVIDNESFLRVTIPYCS